jgi:hypothetical protein
MNKLAIATAVAASLAAVAQHAQALVAITFPGIGWF